MGTEVITIDGPTSSGKNSVGFLLAKKLGFKYIDSGSIYRAGCIFILRKNISLNNIPALVHIFENLEIEVKTKIDDLRFIANGEDVTDILHSPAVTRIVSQVSAFKEVREATKVIQRNLAKTDNTVMTGRDIGSEIFPNASYKFFLTADPEIRAKRRFKQLVQKDADIKYEDVLSNMLERDKRDSTREVSPMRMPKNAVLIDNSYSTVEQTVDEMLKHIRS